MKIVYCTIPRAVGVYTFYRNFRQALKPYGCEVFGVDAGKQASLLWQPEFADDHCLLLAKDTDSPLDAAKALADWVNTNKIDIFIPESSWIAASTVPHLPPEIRIVTRCNSISRHTYDIVCNNRNYVSRIIATSVRQYDDLLAKRGIPKNKLVFIPHGTNVASFIDVLSLRQPPGQSIRLGYVGRLNHASKGCLYLASLVRYLEKEGIDYTLDIVGDGPDESKLEMRLSRYIKAGTVRLHGRKTHQEIPALLKDMDIFLMPSLFEGFGFSLAESMAAGCVPVVSQIRGVTDWIVKNGETGYVCKIGDMRAFAAAIRQLVSDRDQLQSMSAAAAADIQERFNLERMGSGYAQVFREVLAEPLHNNRPRPWSEFRLDPAYAPTWRRFVPQSLKSLARRRLGVT